MLTQALFPSYIPSVAGGRFGSLLFLSLAAIAFRGSRRGIVLCALFVIHFELAKFNFKHAVFQRLTLRIQNPEFSLKSVHCLNLREGPIYDILLAAYFLHRLLPIEWLTEIWRPDSFFKNAKSVTFQTMTIPNHYIWLWKDKTILYMVK